MPVHVRNEIVVAAPPDRVFAWLIRTSAWAGYSGNPGQVQVTSTAGQDLAPGARFSWKDIPLQNRVTVYEQGRAIGWESSMLGTQGSTRWTLVPEGSGTRVVCEESDDGWLVRLLAPIMARNLDKEHRNWLAGLAQVAPTGNPPE